MEINNQILQEIKMIKVNKNWTIICLTAIIVACCSIIYELALSQVFAVFFGSTITSYSVTIGFYLTAMGFGAMLTEGRFIKKPVLTFLKVETFLILLGGFSVIFFYLFDFLFDSKIIFLVIAYCLVIAIGLLTGFEIPLLIKLGNEEKKKRDNIIISFDYLGSFIGAIIFAFIFFPKTGLFATAFFTGLLNALAGFLIFSVKKGRIQNKKLRRKCEEWLMAQFLLAIVLLVMIWKLSAVENFWILKYLN